MIIAAIDARNAYPGLVILDVFEPEARPENQAPPKVLFAGTRMLGLRELIPDAKPGFKTKSLVCTDVHVRDAGDAFFDVIGLHGAERVIVTAPEGPDYCQDFSKETGAEVVTVEPGLYFNNAEGVRITH